MSGPSTDTIRPLASMKPPRRGFEPFHRYFSPESTQYPFKPNMKLLFALMPYLCRTKGKPPEVVLCPMAGVGAAPIMVLAYYTQKTTVIAWEDDEKWRNILKDNLTRNEFCKGRWKIEPLEEIDDEVGDSAVFCPDPSDPDQFVETIPRILILLYQKLKKNSPTIIVSRRVEIDLEEAFYTELALEQAIQELGLYEISQIATVTARTPQRRLYNKEAQKDVFAIIIRR